MSSVEKFLYYIAERKAIRDRRLSGQLAPWTSNEALRTRKFCCVIRDDDRTSRQAREFILALPEGERLAATLAFRTFNRIEALRAYVGAADRDEVVQALTELPAAFNTIAYRINLKGGLWNIPSAASIVTRARHVVKQGWQPRASALRTCEALRGALELGSFVAYQTMQDLRWLGHRYTDEDEWCYLGVGAMRGMRRVLGTYTEKDNTYSSKDRKQEGSGVTGEIGSQLATNNLKNLLANLRELLIASCLIEPRMNLFEIEHNLCEFDKWCRVSSGERAGTSFKPRDEVT